MFSKIMFVSLALSLPALEQPNVKYFDKPDKELTACYVDRVIDGDTFSCQGDNDDEIRVRLAGIDAPEKKQEFGKESTQALKEKIYNKVVILRIKNQDLYLRKVAYVYTDKENSVNEELVSEGYAWIYETYLNKKELEHYKYLQDKAKQDKKGLWKSNNPINTKDFRKKKRLDIIE